MKKLSSIIFVFFVLAIVSCGGSSTGGSRTTTTPSDNPDPDAELTSLVENSFTEAGLNITVSPSYHDFGETKQRTKLKNDFTLTNGTSSTHTFTMTVQGTSGGFRMVEGDGVYSAYKPNIVLAAGQSITVTIQFDAALVGTRYGYLDIVSTDVAGNIHLPFKAKVNAPADFSIISSAYMCSNDDAPVLSQLDFEKVASGKERTLGVKICNNGGDSLSLNSVRFNASTSTEESSAMTVDVFSEFAWEVSESFDTSYFDYYNPSSSSSFSAPSYINYVGAQPQGSAAFQAKEHTYQINPDGLVIAAGSYVILDITFKPTLDIEAPEGQLYNPVAYAAELEIGTTIGEVTVDLLGATSGREPVLEVAYAHEGATDTTYPVDLKSYGAAINFGNASIYEDWITEDTQEVTLTLTNAGTGSKSLKVWADSIHEGYFTFVEDASLSFPLELAAGQSRSFKMIYAPTPEDGKAEDSYNMGQLMLRHSAGNGPINPITLVGQQETSRIVDIFQDISKLKNDAAKTPYSDSNRKNFCNFGVGAVTNKNFKIINNSSAYTLTTKVSVSALTDANGDSVNVRAAVSSATVETPANSEGTFDIIFTTGSDVNVGTMIYGIVTMQNNYPSSAEAQFGSSPTDYHVYFKAQVAETGECTGGGNPVDGDGILLVDRITMILDGLETARNPAASKTHIPIKTDTEHGTILIKGVEYDPIKTDPNTVNVFKPYNHQMTSVNGCFPMPTNPYRQEAQTGSWDGPAQCPYTAPGGTTITGTEVCIPPNKPELVTIGGVNYYVFYHEFVKFNPDNCAPVLEGKIATFHMTETQTVKDVFEDMAQTVGTDGTATEYQTYLKTFQFESSITFHESYNSGVCKHAAGTVLKGTDNAEAIKSCWESFGGDATMMRAEGMIEECSYFFFDIKKGCVPSDVPWIAEVPAEDVCTDKSITYSDPDTWVGFGEYEPHVNLATGEESDTKWDYTIRNVHLEGSFVVNSLGPFFSNAAKLLFADLHATITTKAIGANADNWNDLIAVKNRADFTKDDIYLGIDEASSNWTNDRMNSEFVAGGDDDISCIDEDGNPRILTSCRGNYLIREDGTTIMPAGEPADFENNARFFTVGLGSFHGIGELAPSFAQENPTTGKGKALVFGLHGCIKGVEEGEEISPDAGCYDTEWDDANIMQDYAAAGILKSSAQDETTGDTRALINFKIFDDDRNRLTNYYDSPNNYYFDVQKYSSSRCGQGM